MFKVYLNYSGDFCFSFSRKYEKIQKKTCNIGGVVV